MVAITKCESRSDTSSAFVVALHETYCGLGRLQLGLGLLQQTLATGGGRPAGLHYMRAAQQWN